MTMGFCAIASRQPIDRRLRPSSAQTSPVWWGEWPDLEPRLSSPSMHKTTVQLHSLGLTITIEGESDPRHPAHAQILRLRDQGLSIRQIAARLNAEGVRGPCGGRWHPTTVMRVVKLR